LFLRQAGTVFVIICEHSQMSAGELEIGKGQG
jgi:hypothetical protein